MGREPATDNKIVDSDASDTGKVRDEQEEGENNNVILKLFRAAWRPGE